MKLTRIIAMLLCIVLMGTVFAGCSEEEGKGEVVTNDDGVEIVDGVVTGDIILELYRDKAPITVQNFIDLANKKFYDGLTFHRILEGFMIQGGDPKGDGTGDSGKEIKGEFAANSVENDLLHTRGVISMARGGHSMDSASCQFFICHADAPHLDGFYAAFGKVVEGMEVVDALATVETTFGSDGAKSAPIVKQYIKEIRVIEAGDSVVKVRLTVGK